MFEDRKQQPWDFLVGSYKYIRPFLYLALLLGGIWVMREVILGVLLLVFMIGCVGFILFKAGVLIFRFGYMLLYGLLMLVAFLVAVGGIAWITQLF